MNLPLPIEFAAMEAETAKAIPRGDQWQYEPKWDGFRALCFRNGDEADIRSKSGQPLARYFPEMVEALLAMKPDKFVLDGELIVVVGGKLSFDDLLQRIHPAESRIRKLAREAPSSLAVFDLLVNEEGQSLIDEPLRVRRKELEKFAGRFLRSATRPVHLSPVTCDYEKAQRWFTEMAGGLDGVIAKNLDCPYRPGLRDAMLKIKNLRTADCVVGGFRYAQKGRQVGSMLLGLFDSAGLLHHVGFSSSFAAAAKPEITRKLQETAGAPGFTGNAPGGPSRWSTERSTEWVALRHELVVEVQYDHFSGGRFRHGTKFLRWRPDKSPAQCRMDQVEKDAASPLDLLK